MKTKEKIVEILEKYDKDVIDYKPDGRGFRRADIIDETVEALLDLLSQQKQEIIGEIEKGLPKEDEYKGDLPYDRRGTMALGFNGCLILVKTQLNQLKQTLTK